MKAAGTLTALALVTTVFVACAEAPGTSTERNGQTASATSVGGCNCPTSGTCDQVSYSDVPSDGMYYVTTFGGGADTQGMACGGTADGTWPYVADEARFGCGTLVVLEAMGKHCVAQVSDCGPNQCVEQAAANSGCTTHHPIVDSSPFITQYIFGISSSGWSDMLPVKMTLAPAGAMMGCPGVLPASPDAGSDAGGSDANQGSDGAAQDAHGGGPNDGSGGMPPPGDAQSGGTGDGPGGGGGTNDGAVGNGGAPQGDTSASSGCSTASRREAPASVAALGGALLALGGMQRRRRSRR